MTALQLVYTSYRNETQHIAHEAGYLDGMAGAAGYVGDLESGEDNYTYWRTPDALGNGYADTEAELNAYTVGYREGFVSELKERGVSLKRTKHVETEEDIIIVAEIPAPTFAVHYR